MKDLKWWSTTQTERNEKEADSVPRKPSNFSYSCVPRLFFLVFILFHNFLDDGYITLKYFSSWNSTLSCLIQKYLHGAIKVNCLNGILLSCSRITITCLFICFLPDFPSAKRTFQTSLVVPLPSYHDPLYPLARYNICLPKVLRVPVSLSLEKSTFAKGAFIL